MDLRRQVALVRNSGTKLIEAALVFALLYGCSLSTEAATFSFDYYVTETSVHHFNPPPEGPPAVPTLPIGSKFELGFEVSEIDSAGCVNFESRCRLTVDSMSLSGPGFSLDEPLFFASFTLHRQLDGYVWATLNYQGRQFSYLDRASESYLRTDGTLTHDIAGGAFAYGLVSQPESHDPIDLRTLTLTAETVKPLELLPVPNPPSGPSSQLLVVVERFGLLGPPDHFPNTVSELARSTSIQLSAQSPAYRWLGGPGDFATESNWSLNEAPGGDTTGEDVVFITADGTYTVSGVPENPLSILNVGNESGTVTLTAQPGNHETAFLFIEGDTRLESGGIVVNIDAVVAREAEFVIAPSGALAFLAAPGEPQTFLIDGRVRIEGGVLAPTVEVGDGPYDPVAGMSPVPGIEVAGPNAGLTVEQTLNLSTGTNSHSEFIASAGAVTVVGNEFITSSGLNSTSSVSLSGNGTSLIGGSGGNGVPFVTIGQLGHSQFSLDQGAMMAVDWLLLGENPGSHGELQVANGASVLQPPTDAVSEPDLPADVFIGFSGNGVVSVDTGGSFFNDRAYAGRLSLGEQIEGVGELSIDGAPASAAGNPPHVGFAETTVGVFGQGTFKLSGGAQWDSEVFSIGEGGFAGGEGSGPIASVGDVEISGSGSELGLYGTRLLVVGADGHGTLSVSDGGRVARSENLPAPAGSPVSRDDPMALVVAAGGSSNMSSTGRLFVDDAVVAGGVDSELRIGSNATGAIGLAVFNNFSLGEFERIAIGVNSQAPGMLFSSTDPGIISTDAPTGTTGELLVAGASHLNVGDGLGSLHVGSRGYLHVDDGATIESGLVLLGAVDGASSPATAGNGAFARITGSGSRIDTELLRVGSTDPVIPRTVLDPGNQLYIEDRAVVAATNVEFSGRATIGIDSEAALIASENIVIGGRQAAPAFAPEQNSVGSADEYTEVSVGTGSFITALGEMVIGDNTRSGLFEPLYTFAALRLEAGAQLTAGSLIIANGGLLSGGSRTGPSANVTAATTEVLDGGTVSPGFSPGTLSFSGDLILHPGASLILEIGGRDPGITYDQLIVAGTISGEANLELRFIDGFLPEIAEEFTLFSAATGLNLQLNAIAFSGLASDAILDFTPGAAGMTGFSVVSLGTPPNPVPLPGSFGLLLTTLLAGLFRSRNRGAGGAGVGPT